VEVAGSNQPTNTPTDIFTERLGKLNRIVYKDPGGEVKVKTGIIVGADGQFLKLKTFRHVYVISKATVSEIRSVETPEADQ
jgi:hypothetical protein